MAKTHIQKHGSMEVPVTCVSFTVAIIHPFGARIPFAQAPVGTQVFHISHFTPRLF